MSDVGTGALHALRTYQKECDGMASLQHFSEREYPADHPYLQTAAEARRPAPPKQRAASMAALGLVDAWAAAINATAPQGGLALACWLGCCLATCWPPDWPSTGRLMALLAAGKLQCQ